MKIDKTKAELLRELDDTKKKVEELNRCQEQFEKARDRYERVLDSTPDSMLFVDTKSNIILVNAQFEKVFGYNQNEIVGKKLANLVPDRYRANHGKKVQHYFETPRVRSMGSTIEIYARKKNGKEFPADISLSPLQTDEGLLVAAAVRDITDRRKAEEQVELNYYIQKVINSMLKISLEPLSLEEQFDRILELILNVPNLSLQSRGAIFLKDITAEVLQLKAQQGFTEENPLPCTEIPIGHCLCGKAAQLAQFMYAEDMEATHEIHDENMFPHGHYCVPIVAGQNLYGLLNVYLRKGHKRSDREETFLTSVASTLAAIIERDRAEQEREDLQQKLSQAEKLAALGRFTANVAHEIRNPLTSVGGFARRLDKVIPSDSREKDYTKIIIAEVNRLEKILKNILSFSRDTVLNVTPNNITEVIERTLMMHEDLLEEKAIAVRKDFTHIPEFPFDQDKLIEALENVILNAVDSMADGGKLEVKTEREGRPEAAIVLISIKDNGGGISEDQLDMIFEPFYTTKAAEGTGLGLSITKKIMESMGGAVEVDSEVGKGSTITISLPFGNNKKEE